MKGKLMNRLFRLFASEFYGVFHAVSIGHFRVTLEILWLGTRPFLGRLRELQSRRTIIFSDN